MITLFNPDVNHFLEGFLHFFSGKPKRGIGGSSGGRVSATATFDYLNSNFFRTSGGTLP